MGSLGGDLRRTMALVAGGAGWRGVLDGGARGDGGGPKHSDPTARACYRARVFSALKRVLRVRVGGGAKEPASACGASTSRRVLAWGVWALVLGSGCVQLDAGGVDGMGDGTEQDTEASRPRGGNVIPGRLPRGGGSGGAPSMAPMFGPELQRGVQLLGSVEYRFEDAAFLHCGLQELWAIRFEGLAFERFQELALGEECDIAGCLFLLAGSGDLSARGRFGNVREYPRELTVTRVTSLERVTRVSDLAALNGVSCPR